MPASTIDELLALVQADLEARLAEARARTEGLKAAADDYLRAVEADLVAEAAARCGLEATRPPTARGAALAVRALAETLPEGRVKGGRPVEPLAAAPDGRDAAIGPPGPKSDADPAVEALWREFQAAGFDALSDALFKPTAEEFACRARSLQARALRDPAALLTRMFRALTAKSFQRNVRDVFGLARGHHGDWEARAERARHERGQIETSPPSRSVSARLAIPDSLRAKIAAKNERAPHQDE